MKTKVFIFLCLLYCACKPNKKELAIAEETRTTGTTKLLVDESLAAILNDQITVFKSDYPNAYFSLVTGNENKILPAFLNDEIKVIVLSRPLTYREEKRFTDRKIKVYTDRFAIDGIALITNKTNIDTNITAQTVLNIIQGKQTYPKKLVFDNPYASTVRYFKDLAKIKDLPINGVYTLQNNQAVIKFVATNNDYIGIVGLNWLLQNNTETTPYLKDITIMGVQRLQSNKADLKFYTPTQENLINGKYPFLRNILIINSSGTGTLGTGFANWLSSPRGQLIVLKSGLGPHELNAREFNFKN